MIDPTNQQIYNAALMGWQYLGDGLFSRGQLLGYYSETGFVKE